MSQSPPSPTAVGAVAVDLLDPSSGRPVRSWTFNDQEQITIGRSPDQDVETSDPYVSRNHANLVYRDGQWLLVSLGRNGVIVANVSITEYPVSGDVNFRLGPEGPTLRFRTTAEKSDNLATICFDNPDAPAFELDETRLQSEVGEIAEGDYFQKLQQRAKQMRHQRNAD